MSLYFYPNTVVYIAKTVKPSDRGKLESINFNQNNLKVELVVRGFAWLGKHLE